MPLELPSPDSFTSTHQREVARHGNYDIALAVLRTKIRQFAASALPDDGREVVRRFFVERQVEVDLVTAEVGVDDVWDALEELAMEHTFGPEGEGDILCELYAAIYGAAVSLDGDCGD